MKVLGIVVEYNPFHNGHLYHLKAARELAGADCVVAVMSGNFVQRGEPAIIDKWARTETALLCGVDLVVELPFPYAMSSAEYFAYGAVKILDGMGAVNSICFGSEAGNIEKLAAIAGILLNEPDEYRRFLKKHLDSGVSFPEARQKAVSAYLRSTRGRDCDPSLLDNPNNILGIEYIKAIMRLKSGIVPMTVPRVGSGYNSAELSGEISSATSIRNVIMENTRKFPRALLEPAVPAASLDMLEREMSLGRGPVFSSDFGTTLLSTLRKMSASEIRSLPYMENGLENRILPAARKAGSYDELLDLICTKRYTAARIRRILFCSLAGLGEAMFGYFNCIGGPAYIRVLGLNRKGRKLLSEIRGKTSVPVITKTAGYKNSDMPGVSAMLALEAASTDQYVLAFKNPRMRASGSEFTRNTIYMPHLP